MNWRSAWFLFFILIVALQIGAVLGLEALWLATGIATESALLAGAALIAVLVGQILFEWRLIRRG